MLIPYRGLSLDRIPVSRHLALNSFNPICSTTLTYFHSSESWNDRIDPESVSVNIFQSALVINISFLK